MEKWKPVVGYEGLYEVSNCGKVRSLTRKTSTGLLSLKLKHDGYLYAQIRLRGEKQKAKAVHRLVAEAFIPNVDNLPQVNHKDENKLNNDVNNLEWCTRSYNVRYGTGIARTLETRKKMGTYFPEGFKRHIRSLQKKVLQISADGDILDKYESIAHASRATGINACGISGCCNGRIHFNTAGGYFWRFA